MTRTLKLKQHVISQARGAKDLGSEHYDTVIDSRGDDKYAVVHCAFHGGAVVSTHRSLDAAVRSQRRNAVADDSGSPGIVNLLPPGENRVDEFGLSGDWHSPKNGSDVYLERAIARV